ncbi:MAG: NADH-quinone oxidoreductase subunit M [Puniceicoccales bacterium]|jgi:NADH-quinone oxidoreductase subunit M|nr:NADH-quinone oxidoreductase subunit M [Puniceicoccales bacterium]
MNLLPWTIYISFIGAFLAWLGGTRSAGLARWTALLAALGSLGVTLSAAVQFQPAAAAQTLVNIPWVPFANYHLAVDGISLTLVLLTGIAATAGILFSWNIEKRTGEFFALFLALIGGVYGVFMSADAFLLFVFYEIAIVPKYFLVAIWGSTNREYGAMKLVLYSFAGSALVMAGLLWAHAAGASFDMANFVESARTFTAWQQIGMFALIFTGFAVLAGMFPFHTWAPTGHVAAPTGASMLLAGVVMKLGAYGCLRVALPAFPEGFLFFQNIIAGLAIIGIIYAGLIALVQSDFKFIIGYSSVSHMGFVLLGLAAATHQALSGAVLQMFSHGVIAGLLFAVVGRMVYERTHTRELAYLKKMPLHRLLPFAAFVFVLAGMASMGMPGFSGFPAEFSILIGTWQHSPGWALLATLGIPISAAFTLRAVHVSFFGKADIGATTPDTDNEVHPLPPITWPEKAGACLLLLVIILIGLWPSLLLDWIRPALESPLMRIAINGAAQ